MNVIGGYILPLTSSMEVGNNDTCKWKLQIILFLYNYTYNMATNLIYYGGQYYIYITLYNKIIFMCKHTYILALHLWYLFSYLLCRSYLFVKLIVMLVLVLIHLFYVKKSHILAFTPMVFVFLSFCKALTNVCSCFDPFVLCKKKMVSMKSNNTT